MSRAQHKLSSRRVETLKTPGWYGDGGGLWLRIDQNGSKRWVFAWERNKRRREMGLGSTASISLVKAREAAADARKLIAQGLDPIEERDTAERAARAEKEAEQAASAVSLFGKFADSYIDTHEEGWKNPKHRQQWRNSIKTHAAALLEKAVDEITTDDIVAVLKPIWREVPETAGRLRGRIENILDAAKAAKHIASPWENPARWRGNLIHLLPKRRKKSQVKHHAAMPYQDLPKFFPKLQARPATAARALELTILYATRTNETLRMTWKEVDLEERVWTIPGERMKMGIEHRIPLTRRGVAILEAQARGSKQNPDAFIFPGHKRGMPLSQMAMTMVLRRMGLGHYTVHGMRSCFRDYLGDMTNHPESIVEHALAHQVGDETERAYRRGDAFLKRRALMQDWEHYLLPPAKKEKAARRLGGAAKLKLAA
ncbi:MAG: Integrase [uncultured Sphingomonadaceae bacterium]|uniref:Integrase n=1 Tax=uncultured Sphingomonadaceae bacterium TaxID=169976 RepID=A0A6J4SAV6_9SPHN|nr:MAG: Integrase [uncultured Sphingomonadaceae bacterium]